MFKYKQKDEEDNHKSGVIGTSKRGSELHCPHLYEVQTYG